MKKVKIILTSVFFVMASLLIAENFDLAECSYWNGSPSPFIIGFEKNNKLKVSWYQSGKEEMTSKIFSYKKEYIGKFPLIVMNENIPEDIYRDYNPDDKTFYGNKFMLLTGIYGEKRAVGMLLLPKRKNEKARSFISSFGEYMVPTYKKPSSILKEKDKEYKIKNLGYPYLEKPWVEGVDGWGIGENFIIQSSHGDEYKHLLIMNGYISAKNPHLYEENGRIKKIEVMGVKSGKKKPTAEYARTNKV